MNIMHTIAYGVLIVIVIIFALLVASAVTGHDKRDYAILNFDETVKVDDRELAIADIATIYKPMMYLRQSTPSPSLLWIWYEAALTETTVDIIYYYAWENEIHPNPTLHKLYSLFRATYFGYPLYDIEYFQISVRRSDGTVIKSQFETSPGEDYFVTISEHVVARYIYQSDGTYDEILTTREGDELKHTDNYLVRFEQAHVLVGVQTWNHLTRLLAESDDDFNVLQDAPIKPLTNEEYSRFKFVRKSQGDYQTIENRWSMLLASLTVFIFIVLPGKLLLILSRHRKNNVSK